MSRDKIEYPKFVIVEMADYGPHVWTFDTAKEAAWHLIGLNLSHCAIFKNREFVYLQSSELADIEKQLEQE